MWCTQGEINNLFLRNFNIKKIYSFEASPINFELLKKINNKKNLRIKINIENYAIGQNKKFN